MERDSCLVDVLLERGLVAHAEPGVQMATGRVNPDVSGRSWRRRMERIDPKDHIVEISAIALNALALNVMVREDASREKGLNGEAGTEYL